MTDLEEALVETLERQAEVATVTFTVDDVAVAMRVRERPRVKRRRYSIAVAAAVLVLLASWALLRSPDLSDTVAATAPSSQAEAVPTADLDPISPTGRVMGLTRLPDTPTRLGPGAVVLDAESVGRVEVGSSPLGHDDAWLGQARCVASDALVACIGGAQLNGAAEVFMETADKDLYSGMRGQPRDTHDSPFAAYTEPSPTGVVLISDLAPEVAVVALVTDEPLKQEPIAGTAVFPFQSDPLDGTVKFLGFDSSGVLNMVFELEIQPPPDVSSLDTAGAAVAIGRIEIDVIDLSWDLYDTVDPKVLRLGPGRYPGTARAGQAGNLAIAGHRTTWGAPFGRLEELTVGDEIRISAGQQSFIYLVVAQSDGQPFAIVEPSDTSVVADTGTALLTLTTHHPEFSARQRLIVQAELVGDPTGPSSAKPDVTEQMDGLS